MTRKEHDVPGIGRIPALTVAQCGDRWVTETLGARGVRRQTIVSYAAALREYVVPAIGQIEVGKLTRGDVQGLVTALRDTLGPSAIHRAVSVVRQILADAVRRGDIAVSPVTDIR